MGRPKGQKVDSDWACGISLVLPGFAVQFGWFPPPSPGNPLAPT